MIMIGASSAIYEHVRKNELKIPPVICLKNCMYNKGSIKMFIVSPQMNKALISYYLKCTKSYLKKVNPLYLYESLIVIIKILFERLYEKYKIICKKRVEKRKSFHDKFSFFPSISNVENANMHPKTAKNSNDASNTLMSNQ